MSTSWVAGVVRAKALARRRVGAAGARAVATTAGLGPALAALASTPYGHDVQSGQSLGEAQHALGASLLWNMRVLAGWLPREGVHVARLFAAGFEVANLDEHLSALQEDPSTPHHLSVPRREPADPPYGLGMLDTAWSRLSSTTTPAAAAEVLETSPWRVRGCRTLREIHLGLRLAWADSVIGGIPEAAGWARAGAALLLIQEVVLEERGLTEPLALRASYVLGPAFVGALSGRPVHLARLRADLPGGARWVFDGVDRVQDLRRGEGAWWHRVEQDGFALLRGSTYDRGPVVGALAVLAADAWRVRAALEVAARGGTGSALEGFDGVA
ncbi:hypothetical protein G6038_03230 [Rhodococcus sp. 14C212]|uniref:hypothetical protein n=1 Tax=Rhodococcus sp. 14C212 TaxID=2711209 RepID=UPI0013EC3473|nr:hypothetical protein [Rhodococcus sp. 14C212]NGP04509.1 hypothetical protein [Rhodococcus sp. 14C212]